MRVNVGEQGLKEIYEFYKTKVKKPVDFKTFSNICKEHNKIFMRMVIDEGKRVRLPYRLGYLRVKKTKMNYDHLKLDYGTYNKTGIKTFHTNLHSDDFKARILWEKSVCVVKGKLPYCFQITRDNKRHLASIMNTPGGHKRYLEY